MTQLPTNLTPPYRHRILRSSVIVEIDIISAAVVRPAGAGQGLSIGDAPAAQLTLTAGGGLRVGDKITYQIGDGDGWIPLGTYTVLTATGNDGLYTYTCADAMAVELEALWEPANCSTAIGVLSSIAAQCGIGIVTTGLTDVPVATPASGYTCRELAGYMAALLGGNAVIDRLGRLTVLVWQLDVVTAEIGSDDTYAGETDLSADSHRVQSLTCTVEHETTSTDEDGLTTTQTESETLEAGTKGAPGISISNPYMTQARVDVIYQALQGKAYQSGSVSYIGHLELDPGDLIRVTDREGNSYLVPIMQLDWTLDGGLRSTAQAFAQSEAENQANYSGPTTQAMERMTADLANFKELYAQNLTVQTATIATLNADKASIAQLTAVRADIETLQADKASIAQLTAVQASISALQADKADVTDLTALQATVTQLDADKASITDLTAVQADIKTLQADIANVTDLTAINAAISALQADKADVTELTAVQASVRQLDADKADITALTALQATVTQLDADKASIAQLTAVQADINTLQTDKASITQLNAANANISALTTDIANISALLAGTAGVGTLQAIHLTADNTVIDNAVITSAMIASLTADKITSGVLYTDKVTVRSTSGNLTIRDNTISISDGTRTRVQIGKDGAGDYNLALWDKSGALLWDASGVYSAGLHDGIIRDIAVAEDANISGTKLDITSVASRLTADGTLVVDAANVVIDNTRLNVAYQTITTNTAAAQAAAQAAQTTAANAKTAADAARQAADTAQADADAAQQAADTAQADADTAAAAAQAAQSTADTAKANAKTAQSTANAAQTAASKAQTDLATAQSNLTAVTNRVGATETEIAEAQAAVTAAQKAADDAQADADAAASAASKAQTAAQAAQSTADTAKSNAATAQSAATAAQTTANTAKTNAATAQSTANAAQTAAANAQMAADNAQADVAALTGRTSTLETSLSAVQGQISSKVWQSDINTATDALGKQITSLSDNYTTLTQTVDGIRTTVGSVQTTANSALSTANTAASNITKLTSRVTTVETTASGISTKVTSLESSTSSLGTRMTAAESSITQNANNIAARVKTTDGSTSSFGWTLNSTSWTISGNGSTLLTASKSGLTVYGNLSSINGNTKVVITNGTIMAYDASSNNFSFTSGRVYVTKADGRYTYLGVDETNIHGMVKLDGTTEITDTLTLRGNLVMDKGTACSVNTLTVAGNATVNGALYVSEAASSFGGDLTVFGALKTSSKAASIGGNLSVTGAATLSSTLTVTGKIKTSATMESNAVTTKSIELVPSTTSSHGGYIDFHFAGSTADYTSRLWENESGKLTVTGKLAVQDTISTSSTLTVSSNATVGGYLTINGTNAQIIHTLASGSMRQMVGSSRDSWYLAYYNSSGTWVSNIIRAQTDGTITTPKGVTSSSDERLKTGWRTLDEYDAFFDALTPAGYQYIDGDGKHHIGFGAQSVEAALEANGLSGNDFAGLVKTTVPLANDEWRGYDEEYGLVYSEFVALNTWQIQALKKRVADLEYELAALKGA